jgi:hypothetical protein
MTVENTEDPLSVPEFLVELNKKYQADSNLTSFWKAESAALAETLPMVLKELPDNYRLGKPLGVGGSGIVAVLIRHEPKHQEGSQSGQAIARQGTAIGPSIVCRSPRT